MTWLDLIAFGSAMFVLAITPGPGVFATVARALASGFSRAALVVAGIVIGDLIFLLFAVYGLAALAETLGALFRIIKVCGGLYLLWLGWRIWRTTPRPVDIAGVDDLSATANFFSGLMITLGNPKVILFYLGFLPTFIDLHSLRHLDVALIALVVSLVLGSVMLAYAYTAAKSRRLFASTRAARNLNRCSGGVMMATGTVLLARN